METKQQEKPVKKIQESSRMVIYLLNGTTENCLVNQWDESIKNTYVIRKNDMEILIPHHAVLKIMFERK
jgi:sRNA-binding regulator protein Hfq